MDGLTQQLIEETFAKFGTRFNQLVADRYSSDEGRRFLFSITDDYHKSEDLQVKKGVAKFLSPVLADISNEKIRKAFELELDYMYTKNPDKSASLLIHQEDYYNTWNFHYHMLLANTGMMSIEVRGAENLGDSAILYVMNYKNQSQENLDKFNKYLECSQLIQQYYHYLNYQVTKQGSIRIFEQYVKPYEDQNLLQGMRDD